MNVPFLDLAAVHAEIRDELDAAWADVLSSSRFVLGSQVAEFESEFAAYVGAHECVAVGNGLDAIHLTLLALGVGEGDEVLVPSHTFIATWLAVSMTGAVPVPVEPAPGSYLMDAAAAGAAVTERTRAILPVHLYGEPFDVAPLSDLCRERDLRLVQDAAQAHGAALNGRRVGSTGTATWSFYPGKNLGALGDGGAVTTDEAELATRLRELRNYGSSQRYVHEVQGVNSRLDEVQAALLRVKLRHLDRHNARRDSIAQRYLHDLSDTGLVLPEHSERSRSAWHLFVVASEQREALQTGLARCGVQTQVHYPLAVHQQRAYASLGWTDGALPVAARYASQVLSLPIGPAMSDADVDRVVEAVISTVQDIRRS